MGFREAATAIIIPWDDGLGVSYTYVNGDPEAAPSAIRALRRWGPLIQSAHSKTSNTETRADS